MPEFKLTVEQLRRIEDIGTRLSRDPAFLAAVEHAMKEVFPVQSGTEVPEVTSGDQPRTERTVSFGWSIPVADDNTVSLAAIIALSAAFTAVGAKAAVAGVTKE